MNRPQDVAVRAGLELRSLVDSAGFKLVVDTLNQQYMDEFFNTSWEAKEEREMAHHRAHVLSDLISTLNTFISIYEDHEAQSFEPVDTDEYEQFE